MTDACDGECGQGQRQALYYPVQIGDAIVSAEIQDITDSEKHGAFSQGMGENKIDHSVPCRRNQERKSEKQITQLCDRRIGDQ